MYLLVVYGVCENALGMKCPKGVVEMLRIRLCRVPLGLLGSSPVWLVELSGRAYVLLLQTDTCFSLCHVWLGYPVWYGI